ncbi:MAG: DUF6089 family protein [Bergeyella sp.]
MTEHRFMTKYLILPLFILLLMNAPVKAQRHELGVQMGMSNLVGDIGRTNYMFQPPIAGAFYQYGIPFYGGILYRMNFNPYQTLRFNLGYSHIQFSDGVAKEYYRRNRGLFGTNSIYEADAVFEYNFFPVNDEQKSMLSPYIFGGIGALFAETPQLIIVNDFKRDAAGNIVNGGPTSSTDFDTTTQYESAGKMTFAVPFGVGLKYKFNYNWAAFGEFMFRPTFSDAIDYSVIDDKNVKITYNKDITDPSASNKSLLETSPYKEVADARAQQIIQNRNVGNINSKDWVNTVSIGLTYSFGRPPCYCDY